MNIIDTLTLTRLKKIVTDNPYFADYPAELESIDDYKAVVADGLYCILENCKGVDVGECYAIINTIDDKELKEYIINVLGI